MSEQKAIIYLDSADYSTLSDPNISDQMEEIRNSLVTLSKHESVIFVFSAAHISEMAPTQQRHAGKATARTELLTKLCKRNAMISFDKLIKLELQNLSQRSHQKISAIDFNGSWFPEINDLLTPLHELNILGNINEKLNGENLNRNQRRALNRTLHKKGALRSDVEKKLGQFDLGAILDKYPMRPTNAITLKNYIFGKASKSDAESAFLESLRDPKWMMEWFNNHYDKLGAIGELVRKPAAEIVQTINDSLIPNVSNIYQGEAEDKKQLQKTLSKNSWSKLQDTFVVNTTNQLLKDVLFVEQKCDDILAIDEYCPGISTCLRVIHSSIRNSLTQRPRAIKNSDIVDALHSLYLPYVTHFKTDTYMTELMKPHAKRHDTEMISDLSKLEI